MKTLCRLGIFMLLASLIIGNSFAEGPGLDGQKPPPEAVVRKMNEAMNQYTIAGGDLAQARPDILLLVEENATSDFAYFMTPVFKDTITYNGIVDTLEEAYTKADAKTKPFVLFNIARVHEIRAGMMPQGAPRKSYLEAARKATARFDKTFQDPNLWAVKGDIESDAGNTDAAIANYKKIAYTGSGTPVFAQYKIAEALQEAGRTPEAEAAYKKGIDADAAAGATGGREMRHYLYQGLVLLYLKKGDYAQAATALTASARVKAEPKPYYLLPYNAEALLQRSSYAQTVLDYANAALALNPDAPGMAALRDKAAAKLPEQKPRLR